MDVNEPGLGIDPSMLVSLRQQIAELLEMTQKIGLSETADAGLRSSAHPAAPPGSADLKRLLQLRAQRRREPTGSFLEWPAWDMLLDLAAVGSEDGHVSVSAICVSSGASQSTALRKLGHLERAGLVRRYLHGSDRRRVCLALTNPAYELVHRRIAEDLNFYSGLAAAFAKRAPELVAYARSPIERSVRPGHAEAAPGMSSPSALSA